LCKNHFASNQIMVFGMIFVV